MADKSLADHGSLAITGRGDGNRWYGRVSIPDSVAKEAGLQEGMRISAKCCDGKIVIQIDEKGPIKFPAKTGKGNPRHAFEAATATLGLKEMVLHQTNTRISIEDGKVLMHVPEDCLASVQKVRKNKNKEVRTKPNPAPQRTVYVPMPGTYGAAAAVLTDANRAGKQVRPMTIKAVIETLLEHNRPVRVLGPNLFNLDGKRNVTRADLLDVANEVTKSGDNNKIILIAD
jgi:antitoxin component of MazEF toxin-antitoxin module